MPEPEAAGYIRNVKRAAKALHEVSGAVRINHELHSNLVPHLHCPFFLRYLDDDFPRASIDYRITEPLPHESGKEFSSSVSRLCFLSTYPRVADNLKHISLTSIPIS